MVEGTGGRNYELAVLGESMGSADGARVGEVSDGTTTLHIDFGERAGGVLKVIRQRR